MIHVFHGFLGSAEDFHFLKRPDVVLHDLYAMERLPDVGADDTLIGYSMGGRIALEIADKLQYKMKKLVLINAHPGLQTEEEKVSRVQFENKILENLKNLSKEDFLKWWNALPIFEADSPITTSDDRYKKSVDLFDKYRLSNQTFHLPKMIEHKDKILFIAGLLDEKYMELVTDLLLPEDIEVKGLPGGHRLFQKKEELKELLISEGIL